MQLQQLSKRDVTLILQGHQEHGACPWEICSLVSQSGTILVPPGGQVVSALAFSTFGNASMKHGVTPVPRFSEWPEISKGVSTQAVDKQEYALHQVEFAKKGWHPMEPAAAMQTGWRWAWGMGKLCQQAQWGVWCWCCTAPWRPACNLKWTHSYWKWADSSCTASIGQKGVQWIGLNQMTWCFLRKRDAIPNIFTKRDA